MMRSAGISLAKKAGRKRLILTIILFHVTFLIPAQTAEKEWELKKQENGITVYLRNAENSDFKELKSVVKIRTSLSSIVALLNDWGSYPEWVYHCGESRTLKKISETEIMHYQTVTAPWPVDNRDFVVRVTITQDPVTKTVYQRSAARPDYIPALPDHIRIREIKASWTLIPLSGGYVQVEYQLSVNPGGTVPAWLVNLAVVDGPYETTLNLRSRVMMEKYQKASFPFIQEP